MVDKDPEGIWIIFMFSEVQISNCDQGDSWRLELANRLLHGMSKWFLLSQSSRAMCRLDRSIPEVLCSLWHGKQAWLHGASGPQRQESLPTDGTCPWAPETHALSLSHQTASPAHVPVPHSGVTVKPPMRQSRHQEAGSCYLDVPDGSNSLESAQRYQEGTPASKPMNAGISIPFPF